MKIVPLNHEPFVDLTPFQFETRLFRLQQERATAQGYDASGALVSVLEAGYERLSPRLSLFTHELSLWTPPTPLQVRALLFTFRHTKYVYDSLGVTHTTTSRWLKVGIDRYLLWRQLLDLAGVPHSPFPLPPLRSLIRWTDSQGHLSQV